MTIQERLVDDQKTAMRAKDKATLNAIRSIQSEVATAKAAPGYEGDVDDALYRTTIATYAKRIRKSKDEYDGLGERGAEHSAKLAFELEYLDQYLPKTLDEAGTLALIDTVLADEGADSSTPAGKMVGAVMRSGQDLDGALVNRLVREAIASL